MSFKTILETMSEEEMSMYNIWQHHFLCEYSSNTIRIDETDM